MDSDEKYCNDELKSRRTDQWARKAVSKYEVIKHGLRFNCAQHVQPACGMQTVPGFLYWLLACELRLEGRGLGERRAMLERCRVARNAPYVEAHPRLFLYSAMERIWGSMKPPCLGEDSLRAIARYRDRRKAGVDNRKCTYEVLSEHARAWLGEGFRLAQPPESLFSTDHAFDAWLSALTALAHSIGRTSTWNEEGIPEEFVKAEGHILILKT